MFRKVEYAEFLGRIKLKDFNSNLKMTELKSYDLNNIKEYNYSEMKIIDELLASIKIQFLMANYLTNHAVLSLGLEKKKFKNRRNNV